MQHTSVSFATSLYTRIITRRSVTGPLLYRPTSPACDLGSETLLETAPSVQISMLLIAKLIVEIKFVGEHAGTTVPVPQVSMEGRDRAELRNYSMCYPSPVKHHNKEECMRE